MLYKKIPGNVSEESIVTHSQMSHHSSKVLTTSIQYKSEYYKVFRVVNQSPQRAFYYIPAMYPGRL